MDDKPDQEALCHIEGPDAEGCVWIRSAEAGEWRHNMGPEAKVTQLLSQWLVSTEAVAVFQLTQDE